MPASPITPEHIATVAKLVPVKVDYGTVLLGGGVIMLMCGMCGALVPLNPQAASVLPVAPVEMHTAFHRTLLAMISDPDMQRMLAAEVETLRQADGQEAP